MRAVELVFAVGWAAFWLYWLVAAFSMKRGRVPWSRELRIRAVIVVVVILLIRLGAFRGHGLNTDPWRAGLGLVLFALGLGFAIWARMHIGRNWGTPMTQKDEPELVTSGPYHLVRHPIYSGILVAGVGTAVALSWRWLIAVALAGVYFLYSATVEERYLTEQFPDTYPAYKRSTKMLVPVHLLTRSRALSAHPPAWTRERHRPSPSSEFAHIATTTYWGLRPHKVTPGWRLLRRRLPERRRAAASSPSRPSRPSARRPCRLPTKSGPRKRPSVSWNGLVMRSG